jgi:hypothetical protein
MKTWEAYIKIPQLDDSTRQFEARIDAENEYQARNAFQSRYGQQCIIGWIKETKNYGLQSAGY